MPTNLSVNPYRLALPGFRKTASSVMRSPLADLAREFGKHLENDGEDWKSWLEAFWLEDHENRTDADVLFSQYQTSKTLMIYNAPQDRSAQIAIAIGGIGCFYQNYIFAKDVTNVGILLIDDDIGGFGETKTNISACPISEFIRSSHVCDLEGYLAYFLNRDVMEALYSESEVPMQNLLRTSSY